MQKFGGMSFNQKRFMRRDHVQKNRRKFRLSTLFSESTKRQFNVFLPYFFVLLIVVLIFSILIQIVYLDPLRTRIEDKIWSNYEMYLTSMSKAQKITMTLAYQQVTTPVQIISTFIKRVVFDPVNLSDLVTWSPDGSGSLTNREPGVTLQNFRSMNEIRGKDSCEFESYFANNGGSTEVAGYLKKQYFGWYNWQESVWENLTQEQREYLIKQNAILAISKSFYFTQSKNYILAYSYYSARQSDDTWFDFFSKERLFQSRFWNSQKFGGPFNCTTLNASGNYNELTLPSVDVFAGQDQSFATCPKDSAGSCLCPYLSGNRNFPIVWRCRPWYFASQRNDYVTFADAYTDLSTGNLVTTVSFKIVDDSLYPSIGAQSSVNPYAIQNIDLDIGKLQKNFGQSNVSSEYSYLVAPSTPNFDTNNGTYYTYTAFVHPLMNGTKMSVLDLEFKNSTNSAQEIQQYKDKTSFMRNATIRANGCNLFGSGSTANSMEEEGTFSTDITKNGTDFYTIFSAVKVCYGNFDEQKTIVVAYLANCITKDKKYEITTTLRESLDQIEKIIIITVVISFIVCFLSLYFCLQRFLQCNFEEPIQILSSVILESGPQEVHQLNQSIEKGEVQMQLELKNLLSAIGSVVIGVQTKVQLDLDQDVANGDPADDASPAKRNNKPANALSQEDHLSNDKKQLLLFNSALNTFLSVQHKIGMGLCFNNIGNIFLQQANYSAALKFYKQAFLLSQEQFYDELNQKRECDMNQIEILCSDISKRSFMKIYASRKYQIACALLRSVINSQKKAETAALNSLAVNGYESSAPFILLPNHQKQQQEQVKKQDQMISLFNRHSPQMVSSPSAAHNGPIGILANEPLRTEFPPFSPHNNEMILFSDFNEIVPLSSDNTDRKHRIETGRTGQVIRAGRTDSNDLPNTSYGQRRMKGSQQELKYYEVNQQGSESKKRKKNDINNENNDDDDDDDYDKQQNDMNSQRIRGNTKNSGMYHKNACDIPNDDVIVHMQTEESAEAKQRKLLDRATKEELQSKAHQQAYLAQAMDLFLDSKSIFGLLAKNTSGSSSSNSSQFYNDRRGFSEEISAGNMEAYEYFCMEILSYLNLVKCQLLTGSRAFVVRQQLRQIKSVLRTKAQVFQLDFPANGLHLDVLVQQYYYLKALMNIDEQNYQKAVKELLQSLNFKTVKYVGYQGESLYALLASSEKFFDKIILRETLETLRGIVESQHIPLDLNQIRQLEEDHIEIGLQSLSSTEPYFFEVFFKENQGPE